MRSAIQDDDPVIFSEGVRLAAEEAPSTGVAGGLMPIGKATVCRPGSHATVVAIGYMVTLALRVAKRLATDGIDVEVLDPRTLSPLDADAIRTVGQTGRLVVVDEAPPACSLAVEVTAVVCEDALTFGQLGAASARVCAAPIPIRYSPPLEDAALPDEERIEARVRRVMAQAVST